MPVLQLMFFVTSLLSNTVPPQPRPLPLRAPLLLPRPPPPPPSPSTSPTLANTASNSCPTVMREGSACGLMMTSGQMPSGLPARPPPLPPRDSCPALLPPPPAAPCLADGCAAPELPSAGGTSGRSNQGRSWGGTRQAMMPFCAWREVSLSPTSGAREARRRTWGKEGGRGEPEGMRQKVERGNGTDIGQDGDISH